MALTGMIFACTGAQALADIVVTVEAAGVQKSQVKEAVTADFNAPSFKPGSYTKLETSIGTYSGPGKGFAIVAPTGGNAAYGGASITGLPGSEQTQYIAIGAQSSQTSLDVRLNAPANYFGMYWAAGDALNQLAFYQGDKLLAQYAVGDVIKFISGDAKYYGNPNNGSDKSEPFAYLNFYGDKNTTFDHIVFSNTSTGSGFESDNHSMAFLDGGDTSGTVVSTLSGVPEPSTLIAGAVGLFTCAGYQLAKRRRVASSRNSA